MKLRVNLYADSLKEKSDPLGLGFFMAVIGMGILAAVAWGIRLEQLAGNLLPEVQVQEDAVLNKQQRLAALRVQAQKKKDDRSLLSRMEVLQAEVDERRRLADQLSRSLMVGKGVMGMRLAALAESREEGLWLTHIHFGESGQSFSGGATREDLLPKWVSRLSSQSAFVGSQFGNLQITRIGADGKPVLKDEQGRVQFLLETQVVGEEKQGG